MTLWDFRGNGGVLGSCVTVNCSIGGSSTQLIVTAISSQGFNLPLYGTPDGFGVATNPDHELGNGQKMYVAGISNMTSASIGGNNWALTCPRPNTAQVQCETTLSSSVGASLKTVLTFPSSIGSETTVTFSGVAFSSFATGFFITPSGTGGCRLATIFCT